MRKMRKSRVEEIKNTYSSYNNTINMSFKELDNWSKSPPANMRYLDKKPTLKTKRLLRKPLKDWNIYDVTVANKAMKLIKGMRKGPNTIAISNKYPFSYRDITLRNWGYNPDKDTGGNVNVKMINTKNIVKNILGNRTPLKDTDKDGYPDGIDCEPRNPKKQDRIADEGMRRLKKNLQTRAYRGL